MKLIEQMRQAIWELEGRNCRRSNMVISLSPLVERYLTEEIHAKYMFASMYGDKYDTNMFEGIQIFNKHPYNEILIYDAQNACYYPELIIKIEVKVDSSNIDKPKI